MKESFTKSAPVSINKKAMITCDECKHSYPWIMEGRTVNQNKCCYCTGVYVDGTRCNGGRK
jgi:hypothetical protein